MQDKKPITIYLLSAVCIFAGFGMAYWAWQNLPILESYPVHWDAGGVPDRYGSKGEAIFTLFMLPIISIFTFLIFYFVPKIEPVRASIDPNSRPYHLLWAMIMILFAGIQYFIFKSFTGLETGGGTLNTPVNFIVAGISLFFLMIGNIMGKLRRNFLFGIKTPWTLSSDLSWDKTHRLAGRMMVGTGLIGLVSPTFPHPKNRLDDSGGVKCGENFICIGVFVRGLEIRSR